MRDLYLISGLGADERVFSYLDLSGFNTHPIRWIDPVERESIESYAQRLSVQIVAPNPILIGISFGGMIAVEIGKQIKTEKIIIISSARSRGGLPPFGYLARTLRFHKLIPPGFLKKPNEILFWFFGVRSKTEKKLVRSILEDTNEKFLKWAIDKIVNWENQVELANIVHIHGSRDWMIPYSTADFKIEGGGHLMIINRAADIDAIIRSTLNA